MSDGRASLSASAKRWESGMGEYEERYPDAYGRSETEPSSASAGRREPTQDPQHQTGDRPLSRSFGLMAAASDTRRGWQHTRGGRTTGEVPERSEQIEPGTPAPTGEFSITTPPAALHRGR